METGDERSNRGVQIQLIDRVRNCVLQRISDDEADESIEEQDVKRIQETDDMITRFILSEGLQKHAASEVPQSSIDKVSRRLIDTLKWRKEYGTNHFNPEEFMPGAVEWHIITIASKTFNNSKMIVVRSNKYEKYSVAGFSLSELGIKYWILALEKLSDMYANGYDIIMFFDMRNFGLFQADFNQAYVSLSILHKHYPCLIKLLVGYDTPFIIGSFTKLVVSALPSSFGKHVRLMDKKTAELEFGTFLPAILGGSNLMRPLINPCSKEGSLEQHLSNRYGLSDAEKQKLIKFLNEMSERVKLPDSLFAPHTDL